MPINLQLSIMTEVIVINLLQNILKNRQILINYLDFIAKHSGSY